jgi:hypothetical protein
VPAVKSLSVCSRRDDDDGGGVDIVQRGRRRRRGLSVQATAADPGKLDVSKATGSDSHNMSLSFCRHEASERCRTRNKALKRS